MPHPNASLPSVQRKSCRVKRGETELEVRSSVTFDMVWEKYASFKLRWKKMDDMKSYMDTITGWLTSSEIINKRIQDELTDLRTHSMKTDLIISFNKKHMSYRE